MGKYPRGRYQGLPAPSRLLLSRSGFPLVLRGVFLRQASEKPKNNYPLSFSAEGLPGPGRVGQENEACGENNSPLHFGQLLARPRGVPIPYRPLRRPRPEAFLFPGYPSDKCAYGAVSNLLFFFSLWKRMILFYPASAR